MKGDHIKNVLTTGEKFENKEEFKEKNYLLVLNHLAKKFGIKNKEEAIDDFKIWFFGDRKKYHFYDTIILLMEDIKAKLE
ncbi:MAG: hypothetical protein LBQ24_04610 [Candidatus Peribacteria bacterium]|jgi:hypothetical protein|nr:hypothetical protein [Candidatus Peribacteria bacterium]